MTSLSAHTHTPLRKPFLVAHYIPLKSSHFLKLLCLQQRPLESINSPDHDGWMDGWIVVVVQQEEHEPSCCTSLPLFSCRFDLLFVALSLGSAFATSVNSSSMPMLFLADTSKYLRPRDLEYSSACSFLTYRFSKSILLPTSVSTISAGAFSFNSVTQV